MTSSLQNVPEDVKEFQVEIKGRKVCLTAFNYEKEPVVETNLSPKVAFEIGRTLCLKSLELQDRENDELASEMARPSAT